MQLGQICRNGVHPEFRNLASFSHSIEKGYLVLFEGIVMILLGTYNHPSYITRYSPKSTYDLATSIRGFLNLPEITWRGMNATWSLHQGFLNLVVTSESKCWNPACDRMTYSWSKRPEPTSVYRRMLREPGNPLGGYLCAICGTYHRCHNGELPSPAVIARIALRFEARAKAGADVACGTCGRLESQFSKRHFMGRDGRKGYYTRKHRVHTDLPGKLLCPPFFEFFEKGKRERTDEEVQILLGTTHLVTARGRGETIRCKNPACGAIEVSNTPPKQRHILNRRVRLVLCPPFNNYANRGSLRNREQVEATLARRMQEEERERAQNDDAAASRPESV